MRLGIVFKPACRADVSRGCMPLPVECLYCSRVEGWYEASFFSGEGASSASWSRASLCKNGLGWGLGCRHNTKVIHPCQLDDMYANGNSTLSRAGSIAASMSKMPSCTDSLTCLHAREHRRAHVKALRPVLKPIMGRRKGSAPEDRSQGSSPCCSLCCIQL